MDKKLRFINQSDTLILPERFIRARIDEKTHPAVRELLNDYIKQYDDAIAQCVAPSFFGVAGTWKTYAAAILAKVIHSRGHKVYWCQTVGDLNKILDYRDYKAESYFTLKDKLLNTEFVIFDDFGQLRNYSRLRELFFEIVDYRYVWKRLTTFTANFNINSKEDWATAVAGFGPALARRVHAMSAGYLLNLRGSNGQ